MRFYTAADRNDNESFVPARQLRSLHNTARESEYTERFRVLRGNTFAIIPYGYSHPIRKHSAL